MAFVSGAPLPTTARHARATCRMSANDADSAQVMSRRAALLAGLGAAVAAVTANPQSASANREYPNVGFLGGGDVVDINNANVRVYVKFPGMYPTLAGLIVTNGPYKSVDELYNLPGLSSNQKELLNKYKDNLTALEPSPEYEIDKFNNGLYR